MFRCLGLMLRISVLLTVYCVSHVDIELSAQSELFCWQSLTMPEFDTGIYIDVHYEVRTEPVRGPVSNSDRFRWPARCWNRMSARRKDRLIRSLSNLKLASHCTGFGWWEIAVSMIYEEVASHCSLPQIRPPSLHATRSSSSIRCKESPRAKVPRVLGGDLRALLRC